MMLNGEGESLASRATHLMATTETLKILLVGNSNSGKSCILLRYTDNTFTDKSVTTIGVDFKLKMLERDYDDEKRSFKLCCFDTAGQERFSKLTSSYYRNAHGVLLVFDLTNKDTFDQLHQWYKEIRIHCPSVPVILVGNKCDEPPVVSLLQAETLAKQLGVGYMQVSAKNNERIEELFGGLVDNIVSSGVLKPLKRSGSQRSVRSLQFSDENDNCLC